MTEFDKYGLSTTVQITSEDNPEGSMTTYLVRGMVRLQLIIVYFLSHPHQCVALCITPS